MEYAPALDVWQHDVQDDQVEPLGHRQMVSVQAVARELHDKTGLGQALLEVFTNLRFVFDQENFHRWAMARLPRFQKGGAAHAAIAARSPYEPRQEYV